MPPLSPRARLALLAPAAPARAERAAAQLHAVAEPRDRARLLREQREAEADDEPAGAGERDQHDAHQHRDDAAEAARDALVGGPRDGLHALVSLAEAMPGRRAPEDLPLVAPALAHAHGIAEIFLGSVWYKVSPR